MEMNGKGSIPKGKSSQNQDSWVPRTPLKPIAPKEPQEDWPGEAHSSRLGGGFPYEFSQEFEEYLESNGGFHNWNVPSAGRAQVFHGSADPSLSSSIGNLSFTDHLALAEANLTVSTDGISSHLMTCLGSQHESDRLQSNPTSQEKCEIINHYQVSVPCWNSYDLNSLPSIVANPASSGTFSNIAPVTPDKSKNVGNKEDSALQNICQSGQAVEERNMDIGVATRRVDPNEHNCDKELLQSIQSDTHNPDEGSNIDLNKTPQQQKQRRRKHRPKVVKEGKTKRTPKPKTPDPTGSKETSKVKRKYVRRNPHNKSSLSPSAKETEGIADPKEVARKSCRRALSFEEEHAPKLGTESNDEKITMRDGQGMGAVAETNEVGRTHEPLRFDRQNETSISQDVLKTNNQTPPRSLNDSNCSTSASPAEEVQAGGLKRGHSRSVYHTQLTPQNMMGAQYGSFPAYQPILNTHGCFPEIYKKKRTEKVTYSKSEFDGSSITSCRVSSVTRQETFCHQNDSEANLHTLKDHGWIPNPQLNNSRAPPILSKNDLDKMPTFHRTTAPSLPEKLTKKRTRGHTRVSDLSSLNGIVCFEEPGFATNQSPKTYGSPYTCIETLVAESRAILARKKRTRKRVSVVNPAPSGSLEALQKKMFYIDRLVEQFKHLNINNHSAYQDQHALVPYHMENQEKSALVLYRRDGTIVPFDGLFNPVRKRRPRPKVDLDEETTRVWQLLMGNINSEGIDGTNKEKEKWWEEERGVFQGRADSFIARMRLVQGDRRFSLWKGSVVDSVIGVFLTQNVSDHLSSSAFMSLVARFPHKSKNSNRAYSEGTNILVKDPHICTLDPEDTDQNEKMPNQPVTDPNNTPSSEDREVVNSSEFFGSSFGGVIPLNNSSCKCATQTSPEPVVIKKTKTSVIEGEVRSLDDEILSQTSVVSSQNSTDSPISLAGERIGSCSETNSEAEEFKTRFGSSNSFLELLGMAGATSLPEVHSQGNRNITSNNNSQDADYHSECSQYDQERKIRGRLDDPNISMGSSIIPHSKLTPNSESPEVECLELLEENRSCTFSKKQHENSVHEQSGLTAECTGPAAVQKKLMVSAQISFKNIHSCENHNTEKSDTTQADSRQAGDREKVSKSLPSDQYKKMQQNHLLQNALAENSDETVSTSMVDNKKKIGKLTADSNIKENKKKSDNSLDLMKSNTTHGKGVRDRKTQEKAYEWDNLRKEAQPNGKKREQTTNTMDSLDWEAVRSADVNEIAQTIKERGMNNVLAERIQDFLNRLVAEHGSIDLEWLRDVPPDKAKEYLLSIRGLGLKSVECVRLLTLHHLAFPVDTNVGRIAVRLGWVPLQPLPESLQLHLLELYPVLESIQKYLWPRLCKLDQRTLYELHYQMITFGKVFCTKSKPNCNACPMRGECRHFASAFASARLSLPGPEEKSLVSATESGAKDQNPADIIKPLPLPMPLPQSNQQAESKYESSICEPIIEEPASPEPTCTLTEIDIEDTFFEDPNEIPTIKLNIEEFAQNLQDYMQKNMELQESEMSKALVALTPDVASIPMPKLKNVNQLRTEHQVYELPDTHPLLEELDRREPDDPCSYLLAIWTPGETANSIQPPERKCNSQEYGNLCNQETCFSCNCIREANSQTVRGTLLIPCRTAMRGSFPLNGTYFQVNEVFADHDSSLNPIDVPRSLIWNLPRRTVYFGTSIPTIFKGLSTEGIQHCFWRGYVCVRGFDQKTRAPRPLMARLHFPASKLVKRKGQTNDE